MLEDFKVARLIVEHVVKRVAILSEVARDLQGVLLYARGVLQSQPIVLYSDDVGSFKFGLNAHGHRDFGNFIFHLICQI